ncbi:hypothetical protein BDP27DRAFT_1438997 [Rhodocollybia butyracea]|uniref:Uncharacterized protein n=1 Tax=Rhodocollybia butyracea TaxID=206335 RepID=A0A9P5TUK0_9AGAR|nr:hypothetical protein BDP27DRAFT_1438997 [Rhodocollybia butyracea]
MARSTPSTVKSREIIDNSDDFEDDVSANSVTDLTHDNSSDEEDTDEIQSQASTNFSIDPEIAADLQRLRKENAEKEEAVRKAEKKKKKAEEKKRRADSSSPKTPAQPRKRGHKSDEKQVPKDLNISISLQLYAYPTTAEAKKPVKTRTAAKTQIWKFDFTDPFSTFEAQLLVRTDDFFKPDKSNIDDYDIAYTVARTAPQPVTLDGEESYTHLVESLKSTSQVVVYVTKKEADLIDHVKRNPVRAKIVGFILKQQHISLSTSGALRDGPWPWYVLCPFI